ncbi:Leucine rich repeat proteins, some proteins contain F-box [Plasmopara halstedii]|uniref:Leucine rich repeat proteins, some proteins contain F-box n=1 Tax=Plasmopara halstedii TaxID=4781 RepID=A0A0P1A823_PLAHL|nr:Leucine rich repeat proteins, some proteins contain F-box [Plasmopara halstedii]CEG36668.1 Leucine rich repeat proteins, some proteins contain F-box [Plasmopara halstedii]|eukprot:XP_024573037.1 Leucine rich repeat proteins, some proteins contain F-box [Plasmopara halstedii]
MNKKARGQKAHHGIQLRSLSLMKRHSSVVLTSLLKTTSDFAYKEIPREVLDGTDIDLSIWSVVASDASLMTSLRLRQHLGMQSNQYLDSLGRLTIPKPEPVVRINLPEAEHITDKTAHLIAATCPELKHLNLERAKSLTEFGISQILKSCKNLESLNLNYVIALEHRALCCIQHLRLSLRSLSIAGCFRAPELSLMRVFHSCVLLEYVDLSYCANVTDSILLALSQRCRKLQYLKLRGCRQISDNGVVALANSGEGIQLLHLDLTRSDLPYKINDISLFAVAQKYQLLQTLSLSGCNMITDVGINYLASGCNVLTDLDVSGCNALTNCSLRILSESMSLLQHLKIRQCSQISNRGIRYLSSGCLKLISLHAEDLPLLSDASSHDVNDKDRQGIAALVSKCHALRNLDLSGCTAIADGTLHCIATMCSALTILTLSGCFQVTSCGITAILMHCIHLTSLDLSKCTQVTDEAFLDTLRTHQDLSNSMKTSLLAKQLVVLRLNDTKISDVTVEWISRHSPLLRELDVSNCQDITDMGLLALRMSIKLQNLWLRNVVKITATGLSWLAETCLKLMFLDVTGCLKIYAFSLQSLASAWKFAVYTNNNHFHGMLPLPRANDWIFIQEYGQTWQAAIRIQSLYKGYQARQRVRHLREERLVVWRIIRLQSIGRGRQARKAATLLRLERQKKDEAAKLIQNAFSKFLKRRQATRLCEMAHQQAFVRGGRSIYAAWRKKRLRERLSIRENCRLSYEKALCQKVVKIQRIWRGSKERRRAIEAKISKAKAATILQCRFRVYAACRVVESRRNIFQQDEKRRECAARVIQRQMQRHRRNREFLMIYQMIVKVNDAAVKIQNWWCANRKAQVRKILEMKQRQEWEFASVVKIQTLWRQRKAQHEIRVRRLAKVLHQRRIVQAALIVQRVWLGRKQKARCLKEMRLKKESYDQVRNVAAIQLQAYYRGQRGREWYRQAQLDEKRQWKQVIQLESHEKFYYNRKTGEVRIRRPQDVLDLLERPSCDNCDSDHIDATIECKECQNMYCDVCWINVHSGGRRKLHEFRALYDYLKQRVDYDVHEFPSCWSSEIEQNEMEGWSLRTYPRRQYIYKQEAWEQYLDPDTGRKWYFNRETNENSYIPPNGFMTGVF